MRNATHKLVSTFGAFVALAGIEHGVGEVLQGSVRPASLVFSSWPGSAFFAVMSGEPAMTLIPNLLLTGILAILVSLSILVWSIGYVHRKYGGLFLMLLSLLLLPVGGGLFPPILGILIGAIATQISAPHDWWHTHLPHASQAALAALWPWFFAAGILSWMGMVPGMNLMDYYLGYSNPDLLLGLLVCMFGFLFLTSICGFVRDCQGMVSRPAGQLDVMSMRKSR